MIPNGSVMVQGPVRIELPDGSVVASDRFRWPSARAGAARYIRCARPAIGGAAGRPMRQLSGRRSDVRPIVQHSIPATGWCTVSSPRLASNPSAGYPPSVSEPVVNDPLLIHLVRPGPTRMGLSRNHSHLTGGVVANVVVPTADYVRFGSPLQFADWGEAGGCQCVVGLVRNTRRNLPI